jgi:hypothetical protein
MQLTLNVFPLFIVIIPCWYYIRTNRDCFMDGQVAVEQQR